MENISCLNLFFNISHKSNIFIFIFHFFFTESIRTTLNVRLIYSYKFRSITVHNYSVRMELNNYFIPVHNYFVLAELNMTPNPNIYPLDHGHLL